MQDRVDQFFEKNGIKIEDILYVYHAKKHTCVMTTSGTLYEMTAPLKEVTVKLPESDFWNIQKGVYVAKRHIADIDRKHNYIMTDGKVFEGRHRTPGEHNLHHKELFGDYPPQNRTKAQKEKDFLERKLPVFTMLERCKVMDDAPVAFCVIELVFLEDGRGIDFVFRYCNKEMAVLEGVSVEEMIDRSFYEVFPNGDKKWIIPYAEVALNGTKQIIRDYSPEVDKNLIIRCFQPEKGFCACILTNE